MGVYKPPEPLEELGRAMGEYLGDLPRTAGPAGVLVGDPLHEAATRTLAGVPSVIGRPAASLRRI